MELENSFTTIMTAIVPSTADGVRIDFEDSQFGWHTANTSLSLKDSNETGHVIEPLKAIGHVWGPDTLKRGRTYVLVGPFGQDLMTGENVIKYHSATKTEVGTHGADLDDLAGKALVNGLGLLLNVSYAEDPEIEGGWNLTVNAKHEWYDSVGEIMLEFAITYVFGHITPHRSKWGPIQAGATMWLNGTVFKKDPVSNRFIVKYLHVSTCYLQWIGDSGNVDRQPRG
ncbi:uncharacterized protein MELLADRAFT_108256 [Melampsora larici-populina 98AG31]|uniref:Uncharacterized protein n=1 Tax=Melampsora larici-populina (strain 98AG31 / pathotype 3-4-7) TaxID=747676 RepID=F4RSH4_MELLP|nr:uncharacterized protein MELLADRAFT_108256 [Melampsora larici-populina 98AG31]EGG04601.1 hypothetical protein MELLADRAFT_108256 [Melampsora larici-populina 98AG31]